MVSHALSSLLIIEPDTQLAEPYSFIAAPQVVRVTTVQEALDQFNAQPWSVVSLSASLPPEEALRVFESLKALTETHGQPLTPVLVVVNTATRLSTVLGTTWGNKLGVVSSQVSKQELDSTLERILA
jgi:DNA-binding response OmpR family regulator